MAEAILGYIKDLFKIVVISLLVILPVRFFIIQPFYVKGASMEPNFFDHEYLIIDEISYRFDTPDRGEVIIFRYPGDTREFFIKRVVGPPGEKVEIKDYSVFIYNAANPDGKKLEEPYLGDGARTYSITSRPVELKENEYYVLGDNRNFSQDSRSFGPLAEDLIIGRAFFRGWPFSRIDLFFAPLYNI